MNWDTRAAIPQILFKAQKLNMNMTIIVMSQFLAKGLEDRFLVVGFLVVLDEWEPNQLPTINRSSCQFLILYSDPKKIEKV